MSGFANNTLYDQNRQMCDLLLAMHLVHHCSDARSQQHERFHVIVTDCKGY